MQIKCKPETSKLAIKYTTEELEGIFVLVDVTNETPT